METTGGRQEQTIHLVTLKYIRKNIIGYILSARMVVMASGTLAEMYLLTKLPFENMVHFHRNRCCVVKPVDE